MKRLSLACLLLSIWLICIGDTFSASRAEKSIYLNVILDTSPTSEKSWNMQHALNVEIVHSLRAGDRLKEWVARPGKPLVLIDTVITTGGYEKNHIIDKISGTLKEWIFSADITRAMRGALSSIRPIHKNYQCCLVIITKGQMSNKMIAQIRRYASAFKARGWKVCIVCDREKANLRFLVAANNKEFDIQFLDQTSLSNWINSARSASVHESLKGPVTRKAKPELEARDKQPVKTEDGKNISHVIPVDATRQPLEVKIVELPGGKGPADINKPDTGKYIGEVTKEDRPPDDEEITKVKGTKESQKRKAYIRKTILLIICLIIVMSVVVLIIYSNYKTGTIPKTVDLTDDKTSFHLIAFYGDHRHDLGPLDALGEISIGCGIGSTIYIAEEAIEDKHARIFKNRKNLKIQNLAASPININGLELAHRRKSILDLPTDIELTNDVTITVLSEPAEMNKEFNNDETENI